MAREMNKKMRTVQVETDPTECVSYECDAFEFMAKKLGVKVLHPGLTVTEAELRDVEFNLGGMLRNEGLLLTLKIALKSVLKSRRGRRLGT